MEHPMPYAMIAPDPGPADVLTRTDLAIQTPASGEIMIRQTAIGVNFIDVYFRQGSYPWPQPQNLITGSEGAGVVEAIGPNVTGFTLGQRVAYTLRNGAYATHRVIPADQAVALPDDISDHIAAAVMLKGLTAHYLIHHSYPVQPGDSVLVHAAAGGVGLIAGQWLAAKGIRAIGTAGGPEKVAMAQANGYAHVIDYRAGDFAPQIKAFTGGQGLQAVYDSVGRDTIMGSLACLATFGTLVSFGQSSGPPDDLRVAHLAPASLRLTRPTLFHHTAQPGWLAAAATDLFDVIRKGQVKIHIGQTLALTDAAKAHRALESRATTGSMILVP
jgi:NADPH:quinone reductase